MAATRPSPVRDWSADHTALIARGDLTLWIDDEVIASWRARPAGKKNGRPFTYSDRAVELVLTPRQLYGLPLRGAQGFARAVVALLGLALPVPHYSTLSRRAGRLAVALGATAAAGGRVLLLDSTGLKVFGEGEWKVRQHGYSKRRTWRKLHLAIDATTQEVVACELTDSRTTDGETAGPLLDATEGEIARVKADGAYDQRPVYGAARRRGAAVVVPPRRGAKIRVHGNTLGPPDPRDENLRGVRRYGRKSWKRRVGYHERSLVETGMFRYKALFGARLRARAMAGQRVEVRMSCKIMNRFTRLGMLTARAA